MAKSPERDTQGVRAIGILATGADVTLKEVILGLKLDDGMPLELRLTAGIIGAPAMTLRTEYPKVATTTPG